MFFKEWFNSSFMDKKKSAREIAKQITEGEKEPEHLGKHTPETLQQELFSLKNTKPAFRNQTWFAKFERIKRIIYDLKDPRIREGLLSKADSMFDGEA